MYFNRIVAAVATIALSATLAVGVAPQSAEAAASVSINGVSKTHAPDIKSKGVIKTPTTRSSGVQVASRSYVIYKGKKVVARTGTQGKAYKLAPGTYTVKSTVKHRAVSTRYGEKTVWAWDSSGDAPFEYTWTDQNDLQSDQDNVEVRRTGDVYVLEYEPEFDIVWMGFSAELRHPDGRMARGTWAEFSVDGPKWDELSNDYPMDVWQSGHNDAGGLKVEDSYRPYGVQTSGKAYGAWKTVTRTQEVTINKNSGAMTYREYKKIKNKARVSKVTKIVGGKGHVIDRYSIGKSEYTLRQYGGYHYVGFKNGKVYYKSW